MLQDIADNKMMVTFKKTVNYLTSLPGFKTLPMEDQASILRSMNVIVLSIS